MSPLIATTPFLANCLYAGLRPAGRPNDTVYLDLSQLTTQQFNEVKSHLIAEHGGPLAGGIWRIDWDLPATGELMDWIYGSGVASGPSGLSEATASVGLGSHQTPGTKPVSLQAAGSEDDGASKTGAITLSRVREIFDRNTEIHIHLANLVRNNLQSRSKILAEVVKIRFSATNLSDEAAADIDWFLTVMDHGLLCRNLDSAAAFDYVKNLLELTTLENLPVDYIRIGLEVADPKAFATYANENHHASIQRIARYFAAGLPWETQFWNDYLNSSDPGAYLQEVAPKVEPWRRGRAFDTHDEEQLRWAYAGLEYPAALCFEQFQDMMRDAPQVSPPFISEGFKTTVPPADAAEAMELEFVPSQSPSDMAVGHVSTYSPLTYFGFFDGPGVLLSDWLQDKGLQMFRILADGHLVGMAFVEPMQLYDIEEDDFAEQKTLGLRILSRKTWNCDAEAVLKSIATKLIPIAEAHGYNGIHLFSSPNEVEFMEERDERFEEAARNLYPEAQEAMSCGPEVSFVDEGEFVGMWVKGRS